MTLVLYKTKEKSLHKTKGRSLGNSQGILPLDMNIVYVI